MIRKMVIVNAIPLILQTEIGEMHVPLIVIATEKSFSLVTIIITILITPMQLPDQVIIKCIIPILKITRSENKP